MVEFRPDELWSKIRLLVRHMRYLTKAEQPNPRQ